jgi:hypothetical protein
MGQQKLNSTVQILHEKCDPKLADDRALPYTAYLVQYEVEGKLEHDIVISTKQVEIFDHYYDKYKQDFKKFTQSAGTVDPRRWMNANQKAKEQPPRKKRKRKSAEDDA